MLLEKAGFLVTPALGFTEASRICRFDPFFDLIVLGHSIPRDEKVALIEMLRSSCKAPVLSISKHNDAPFPEADFSIESYEGPQALIAAIKSALGSQD